MQRKLKTKVTKGFKTKNRFSKSSKNNLGKENSGLFLDDLTPEEMKVWAAAYNCN